MKRTPGSPDGYSASTSRWSAWCVSGEPVVGLNILGSNWRRHEAAKPEQPLAEIGQIGIDIQHLACRCLDAHPRLGQ